MRSRGSRGDRRDVMEDPSAALALDDGRVAAYVVVDLRTQTDVALAAQTVLRFGDRDAPARVRHALERGERFP